MLLWPCNWSSCCSIRVRLFGQCRWLLGEKSSPGRGSVQTGLWGCGHWMARFQLLGYCPPLSASQSHPPGTGARNRGQIQSCSVHWNPLKGCSTKTISQSYSIVISFSQDSWVRGSHCICRGSHLNYPHSGWWSHTSCPEGYSGHSHRRTALMSMAGLREEEESNCGS